MKKIKNSFKFIIFIIFLPILFILLKIFKIKIGYLVTNKVGELCSMAYAFFLNKKYNNKISKYSVIWITHNKISNLFIYKNIRRELFILNNFLIVHLYKFLQHFNFKNYYIDKHTIKSTSIISNFELTNKNESLISFNNCENQKKLIDKEYDIKDVRNIICFTARTKYFHENEEDLENDRNYSVLSLNKTFKHFTDKKYKFFRINSEKAKDVPPESKKYFIDPKIDEENFIHSYLISKCKFFISSNSGPVDIAIILKRPILYINFTDMQDLKYCNPHFTKNIIFKKYKNLYDGEILNYKTVIEKKISYIHYEQDLGKNGYEIIENTQDEILNASIEINNTLNKKNGEEIVDLEYNKIIGDFFNFYEKFFNQKLPPLNISKNFLRKNIQLFLV